MNLKQKNFYNISELYNLFNTNSKNISLVTHFSNLNVLESNLLKIYCDKNSIQGKYIKINLIKKITKNSLFLNLFSGPTRIFFFQNIHTFLEFSATFPLRKKIMPLAVIFDNKIYSYTFFYYHLHSLQEKKLLVQDNQLLKKLVKNNQSFIISLKNPLQNFIISLTMYTTSNKII